MKIDAHNHPNWHGHNFKKFMDNINKYKIDKTWLLTWETPNDELQPTDFGCCCGDENFVSLRQCTEYKEKAPERFVLGYAPDPRKPYAIEKLKAAIDVYGVQVCGELKLRMMLDNFDAIKMYRFCGEHGLPVTVHIDYDIENGEKYPRSSYWYGGGIDALERAMMKCPETNFLGHAPGFWAHISDDDLYCREQYPSGKVIRNGKIERLLRKYPNLYCDMSAMSAIRALGRDIDFSKEFLTEFQDRVLYARDLFGNDHAEFLDSLGLNREILDKIYFKNAQKLIRQVD